MSAWMRSFKGLGWPPNSAGKCCLSNSAQAPGLISRAALGDGSAAALGGASAFVSAAGSVADSVTGAAVAAGADADAASSLIGCWSGSGTRAEPNGSPSAWGADAALISVVTCAAGSVGASALGRSAAGAPRSAGEIGKSGVSDMAGGAERRVKTISHCRRCVAAVSPLCRRCVAAALVPSRCGVCPLALRPNKACSASAAGLLCRVPGRTGLLSWPLWVCKGSIDLHQQGLCFYD